jgi:hypothetical protein
MNYLYRALRLEEIDKGCILIPKSQNPFRVHPRLGIDTRLPFKLGEQEEYAVRQHQWQQKGFTTSGVSTTPHLDRAKHYAQKEKIIVKINRDLLPQYDIKEYIVKEWLKGHPEDIAIPEDDEVILVSENVDNFQKEIIKEIIKL